MISIDIDSMSRPHISYAGQYLRYAKWDGTKWNKEIVDSAGFTEYQTIAKIALDSFDRPHISYYDKTNGDLKYAWFG